MPRVFLILSVLAFCSLAVPFPVAYAQERSKVMVIGRTTVPPRVDGLIDDACWKSIEPYSGFVQYDPLNGEQPGEETYVWAAYDDKYIYFAFLMKDSRPEQIWAELTPRNEYDNNDSIKVILDTYNDRRTSVSFTLNAKGVQKNSFETIWKSGASKRNDGWAAEMAIPFNSLRFSTAGEQVWGVNFERYIHRLKETDTWTHVNRDLPELQQAGELRGLTGIKPGHNLEFFPYAGVRTTRWDGEKDDKLAAGLDIKYGLKPNVCLDLTASPDFSEVESDPFIYQLSPYENYLSENRPFFSEGSQYFDLATEDGFSDIKLFYSRRIENPEIAAKLSGKTSGWSFGLLGAFNKVGDGTARFGILRVQKDVFKNSQIGFYYTGLDETGGANQNFALDYSFNFGNFYYLRGMSGLSLAEDGPRDGNTIHIIQFEREPDEGLQLSAGYQRIGKNMDMRAGYLDMIDIQTAETMIGYAWRFSRGAIKRLSLDLNADIDGDSSGARTGEEVQCMFFLDFFSRMEVDGRFSLGRRQYQVLDAEGRLIWNGEFLEASGWNLEFEWERGGFLKDIRLEIDRDRRGIYNDDFTAVDQGSQWSLEGSLALKPRSNVELSVGGDWIRQTVDETGQTVFEGLTYEAGLHYQITKKLFVSTMLLGETRENQYNFDLLIGYYFGAGNIIQLSYKKSERKEGLINEGGHSITLKVSYLFRL